MKQVFVNGAGRCALVAGLLCLAWLPGATLADEPAAVAVNDPVPAAPGPLTGDDALRLVLDLDPQPVVDGASDLDLSLRDSDLIFAFDDQSDLDPIEAYQARQTKPSSGMRVAVDPDDAGLTFHWRIGF
ncbi:MAG: hypothetical protein QNJ73_14355 [Gammaproteobacteria bacterium]|nr:hypothetical protein [Gammaproteobacteria bacterium]